MAWTLGPGSGFGLCSESQPGGVLDAARGLNPVLLRSGPGSQVWTLLEVWTLFWISPKLESRLWSRFELHSAPPCPGSDSATDVRSMLDG
jgi:hypothetical protein